jgi:lipopolysaccharide transport system ATP-binding protein
MTTRVVLLNAGQIAIDGSTARAISMYLSHGSRRPGYECSCAQNRKKPHVHKAEVVTSDANGIHRFGEPLEVKFHIRHDEPLVRSCFAFQIINQNQQPVVHAFAFYPDIQFGRHFGESLLVCRFPSLRLNVGEFCLRTFLSEPPGGEFYESLDGICHFEIVRTDEAKLWGWQPEACAYHEQWAWTKSEYGSAGRA